MDNIKLIAHRGGYKESNTKENSKEAIKYAITKDYIDGIEFDVRITKDNKIILMHDCSLKYNNKRYKISNTNYEELNKIYLKKYNTKLNTIEEILYIIPKNKIVFLEIKNFYIKNHHKYLELIYNIIKKYPTKQIVIISFFYKYLKYFQSKGYDINLLLNRKSRFFEIKTYFRLYLNLNLDIISLDKKMIDDKNCKTILKRNKLLGIYTIENWKEIEQIFNKIGIKTIKKYKNKIFITTTNPKAIYERILLYEKN